MDRLVYLCPAVKNNPVSQEKWWHQQPSSSSGSKEGAVATATPSCNVTQVRELQIRARLRLGGLVQWCIGKQCVGGWERRSGGEEDTKTNSEITPSFHPPGQSQLSQLTFQEINYSRSDPHADLIHTPLKQWLRSRANGFPPSATHLFYVVLHLGWNSVSQNERETDSEWIPMQQEKSF